MKNAKLKSVPKSKIILDINFLSCYFYSMKKALICTLLSLVGCALPAEESVDRYQDLEDSEPRIQQVVDYKQPQKLSCLKEITNKEYQNKLYNSPKVVKALNLCSLPEELRQKIWQKFENNRSYLPEAYNTRTELTTLSQNEAFDIYALKIAHALWLDLTNQVPWKLEDMTDDELKILFDPQTIFWSWDIDQQKFEMLFVLDYSPTNTFQISSEFIRETQKKTVDEIIELTRSFTHGTSATLDGIVLMDEMVKEQVSRRGCWTMVMFINNLARNLNIPAFLIDGYYMGEQARHATGVLPSVDGVLAHGDHVYSGPLRATPSSELLDSYSWWQEHVLIYPPGDLVASHNSRIHEYENAMKYPSLYTQAKYCVEGGQDKLTEMFGEFASDAKIEELIQKINEITNNCKFFE